MPEFRPVREWLNRLEHETIKVEKLLQLKSSQMIIVYSKDNKSNSVERRLIQGPCIFMPQPNEWYLHLYKKYKKNRKFLFFLLKAP
jgi:hypothetical protein